PEALVRQLPPELAHRDITERLGQLGSRKALDAQILDADPLVIANQIRRQLVKEVPPLVGDLLVDARQSLPGFLAPLAPSLAPFEVALFHGSDDQIATRYSLGCDWPKSLPRRFRPAGVSRASASRSSSFCSADCRTAPAKP